MVDVSSFIESIKFPYFVGMEYHTLILNRTYLVIMEPDRLTGIKVNGVISTNRLTFEHDLRDPLIYINPSYMKGKRGLEGSAIIENRSDFSYAKEQLRRILFNPKKKWGMGNYPHNGRIKIFLNDGKSREFILLGSQNEEEIIRDSTKYYNI